MSCRYLFSVGIGYTDKILSLEEYSNVLSNLMVVTDIVVITLVFYYLICKLLYVIDIEVLAYYTVLSLRDNHLTFCIK